VDCSATSTVQSRPCAIRISLVLPNKG
jgi:hypothetical protein